MGMLPLACHAIDEATTPPPGLYYIAYFTDYRSSDIRLPVSNQSMPGDNRVSSRSLINRLMWISDHKVLGADYGMEMMLATARNSLEVNAYGLNARVHDSGVADIYVSPLILGWHQPRWDVSASVGLWLDNARSDGPLPPGKGYRSTFVSGGTTYYWDDSRSWTTSALLRYQAHGKKDSGWRRGDEINLDWGVGKRWGPLQAGVVGTSRWQVKHDSAPGAMGDKGQMHSVGLRASYFFWPAKVMLRTTLSKEMNVRASSQPATKGHQLQVMVAKVF